MKTLTLTISLGFLFLYLSCGNYENKGDISTKSTISKITVAISAIGCESGCSNSALSLDSSLNLKYYAGWGNPKQGFYKAHIGQNSWDSIRASFDKFIISGIDTTTDGPTDQPIIEIIISDSKKSITYKGDSGRLPIEVHRALNKLKKLKEEASFHQVDTIPFETETQFLTIPVKQLAK